MGAKPSKGTPADKRLKENKVPKPQQPKTPRREKKQPGKY